MIRRGDAVIGALALALVAGLALQVYTGGAPHTVRITSGNGNQRDLAAWHAQRVSIRGPLGDTVIEIDAGRARVVASPCTQKLCMRSGWLDNAGDATACLPNRISVALLGGDPRFDAVNF